MTKSATTNRDMQRAMFVDSIHASLNKASRIMDKNEKFLTVAQSYLQDGLTTSECVELLVIDGLSREAAFSCVESAEADQEDSLSDYSFQFEEGGRVWSSYDLGLTIKASSEEDALVRAERLIAEEKQMEDIAVLSVNRIS